MAMGGGGGAAESPADRMKAAYLAGITDPQALEAIGQGMTPLTYANYSNAKNLLLGGKGQPPGAFQDVQKYGMEMANLAKGGLYTRGLKELNKVTQAPSVVPGVMDRMAARYGIDSTKQHSAGGNLDTAVPDTASRIGLGNQVRRGLVNAQYGLRFGGISV